MDQLINALFPEHLTAGAEFKLDSAGQMRTFLEATLFVNHDDYLQTRPYRSSQVMTSLGALTANVVDAGSQVDGISKRFLTPEGGFNLPAITHEIKATHGLTPQMATNHEAAITRWDWSDNHSALVINMLRYVMLRRLTASKAEDNKDGIWGIYDDGHVTLNLDEYYTSQPKNALWAWPGRDSAANYPEYVRLNAWNALPANDRPTIDLSTMTMAEARFTLLMCGAWQQNSRMRLDFSTPMLAEGINYRSDMAISQLDSWHEGGSDVANPPALPTWQQAWSAVKKYVTRNRAYSAFSAAVYAIAACTYQMYPSSAEAAAWLRVDWYLSIPKFSSVRGRYVFLNEDEAALLSHRALSEWSYFSGPLERLNLLALTFSQAYQTGIAVRAIRQGLEESVDDLMSTIMEVSNPATFLSAMASEALRIKVPLPGTPGLHLTSTEEFFEVDALRYVFTDIVPTDGEDIDFDGYDVSTKQIYTYAQKEVVPLPTLSAGALPSTPSAATETPMAGVAAPGDSGGSAVAGAEQAQIDAAKKKLTGPLAQYTYTQGEPVMQERVCLQFAHFPMAGVPVLILPLNCFKENTPFSLNGAISTDNYPKIKGKSVNMSPYQAWEWANLARLCGYDVGFRSDVVMSGPQQFFSPNDANFTYPVLTDEPYDGMLLNIYEQDERQQSFIQLPVIYSRFFKGQIDYKSKIRSKGTSLTFKGGSSFISEYGGKVSLSMKPSLEFFVPEGVTRLRGFISRDETGFQFVGPVAAGQVPQSSETAGAAPAGGM